MKSTIACLLVLAVAAQAQWVNYGYGLGGYGGYYGGYYPFTGVRTTAYTGYPTAALPVTYGYPAHSASQYHAQDEFGGASFGYSHPGQAAANLRDGFGNQIGSYAYINPEGKEVRVSYTADSRGFRVASNNLPVAPVANLVAPVQVQDTPEVAQAKAAHMAALAAAKSGTPARAKRQAAHPFPAHVGVGQIGGAHPGPAHVGAGQIGGAHPGPAHVGANQRGGAHPCPAFVAC